MFSFTIYVGHHFSNAGMTVAMCIQQEMGSW